MSTCEIVILLSILLLAVYTDFKSKRISNKLIITGFILILSIRSYEVGLSGLISLLTGLAIPILLLFILFFFGMLGGGDIKLLALTGALTGPGGIISCIALSFAYGALLSLIKMISKKNLLIRLQYLAAYITRMIQNKERRSYYIQEEGDGNIICFSICILLGFITYLIIGGV